MSRGIVTQNFGEDLTCDPGLHRVRRMSCARRQSPAVSSASSRSTALSDVDAPWPSMTPRNQARSGCRRSINTGRRRLSRFRTFPTTTPKSMPTRTTAAGPQITTTTHSHHSTMRVRHDRYNTFRPETTFSGVRGQVPAPSHVRNGFCLRSAGGARSGPRPRWLPSAAALHGAQPDPWQSTGLG
jgi:hypothetical protein